MPTCWPFGEWLAWDGPTNLPPAQAEADLQELGRRWRWSCTTSPC
jgi:hypothetical protein